MSPPAIRGGLAAGRAAERRPLYAAVSAAPTEPGARAAHLLGYDFGQIAVEAAMDSGCTATGRPFCHCTMHSIPDSDTREPLPTVNCVHMDERPRSLLNRQGQTSPASPRP